MIQTILESPVGPLGIVEQDGALVRIDFGPLAEIPLGNRSVLSAAKEQLSLYFAEKLQRFDLPLAPRGTAFQKQVWHALTEIPYGTTETYGQLAARIGKPKAARAVGQANNRNPLPIVIPCHRVIGADGTLTGYSDGMEIKRILLRIEGIRCER